MRKKKELTQDIIIDKWLGDYHNTSLDKIIKANPEWEKDPHKHTRTFYEEYAVTQEQHDAWHDWMIDTVAKYYHVSKKSARKSSWAIYLNAAPSVKEVKP